MATGCASSSIRKRAKRSVRHQLQLLEPSKKLLLPRKSVDNTQFMNALFAQLDRLESQSVERTQQ